MSHSVPINACVVYGVHPFDLGMGRMRSDAKTSATIPNSTAIAAQEGTRSARYPLLDLAMDRYAQGDDSAFTTLYEGLTPRLRGFLLRLSGNPAIVLDLTQEAFLRIFRARGMFEHGSAVVPWALAIARNVYLDHARKGLRAGVSMLTSSLDDDESAGDSQVAAVATGEQLVLAQEVAHVVRGALAALPVSQREAFVLLRFEGLTVAEAAEVLGTTDSAVRLRAFRAYEAIRSALKAREEES